METLIIVGLAILGIVFAFFKGKSSAEIDAFWASIEEERKIRESQREATDAEIRAREQELEEIDDRMEDNQGRELTPEETIRVLRGRHGWGPTDDTAP